MLGSLEGSNKPFIATSGVAMLAQGRAATEQDQPPAMGRGATEAVVRGAAKRGVRTGIIRLPPSTHGAGDGGFTPHLIGIAREKGVAAYVGEGTNRWAGGRRADAARLYRLALESAPAGTRLHGVADEGVPFREIAEVIGSRLGLPTASVDPQDAGEHFGFLGALVGRDNPTSNALTRKLLGWEPVHAGLLDDLATGHYFDGVTG